MSTRPGTQQFAAFSAIALGTAAGQDFALGNGNSPAALNSLLVTWVATATAGSRIPIIQIETATEVNLWQVAGGAITAGQTVILAIGAGVPPSTVANPLMQFLTMPFDLPFPINGAITIFDQANIDVNDTVALVANYTL